MENQEKLLNSTLCNGSSAQVNNISALPATETSDGIKSFIDQRQAFKLSEHGDAREREFVGSGLLKDFPQYEEVWRLLIIPATNRLHGSKTDIGIRQNVSDEVLLLCQFHYSLMNSSLRAYSHWKNEAHCLFDFFCSLQNANELVDLFVLTHGIVFERQFTWSELWSKTDGLKKDEKRVVYLNKCAITETKEWKDFNSFRNGITCMRNALVHGPEIATYLPTSAKEEWSPRIGKYKELLWTDVPQTNYELIGYFQSPEESMQKVFESFLQKVNACWKYFSDGKQITALRSEAVRALYGEVG